MNSRAEIEASRAKAKNAETKGKVEETPPNTPPPLSNGNEPDLHEMLHEDHGKDIKYLRPGHFLNLLRYHDHPLSGTFCRDLATRCLSGSWQKRSGCLYLRAKAVFDVVHLFWGSRVQDGDRVRLGHQLQVHQL